jgi:hypothetical protein
VSTSEDVSSADKTDKADKADKKESFAAQLTGVTLCSLRSTWSYIPCSTLQLLLCIINIIAMLVFVATFLIIAPILCPFYWKRSLRTTTNTRLKFC